MKVFQERYGISFVYDSSLEQQLKTSHANLEEADSLDKWTVEEALKWLFGGTNISWKLQGKYVVLKSQDVQKRRSDLVTASWQSFYKYIDFEVSDEGELTLNYKEKDEVYLLGYLGGALAPLENVDYGFDGNTQFFFSADTFFIDWRIPGKVSGRVKYVFTCVSGKGKKTNDL